MPWDRNYWDRDGEREVQTVQTVAQRQPVLGSLSPAYKRRRRAMFNTTVYQIPKEEAERQLALYSDFSPLTDHERRMLDIYDAIVKGDKFIELTNVLRDARAQRSTGTPKLAVAPVTASEVTYERSFKRMKANRRRTHVSYKTGSWRLELTPIKTDRFDTLNSVVARALAPSIPPQHREKIEDGDLLVWEPSWRVVKEKITYQRVPDPAIIRQINNDIYKVVAAWNMTEIEARLLAE